MVQIMNLGGIVYILFTFSIKNEAFVEFFSLGTIILTICASDKLVSGFISWSPSAIEVDSKIGQN